MSGVRGPCRFAEGQGQFPILGRPAPRRGCRHDRRRRRDRSEGRSTAVGSNVAHPRRHRFHFTVADPSIPSRDVRKHKPDRLRRSIREHTCGQGIMRNSADGRRPGLSSRSITPDRRIKPTRRPSRARIGRCKGRSPTRRLGSEPSGLRESFVRLAQAADAIRTKVRAQGLRSSRDTPSKARM